MLLNALSYLLFIPVFFQFKKAFYKNDFTHLITTAYSFSKKYKGLYLLVFSLYSAIAFLYSFSVDEIWLFSYFYKKPVLSPFVFYALPSNHILYSNIAVFFTLIWNSIYTWRLVSVFFLSLSIVLYYHFLRKKDPQQALAIILVYACLPMVINTGVHAKGYALLSCILFMQLISPKFSSLLYWIGVLVHPAFLVFGWLPLLVHYKKTAVNKQNLLILFCGIAFYTSLYLINSIPHKLNLETFSLRILTENLHSFLLNGISNQRISQWFSAFILLFVIGFGIYKKERLTLYLIVFSGMAIIGFYAFSLKIVHYRMLLTLPILISFVIGKLIKNKILLSLTLVALVLNFFISERVFLRYQHHKWLKKTAFTIINTPELKGKKIKTNLNRLSTYVEYYSVKKEKPYQWEIDTETQEADTTFNFRE